METEDFNKALSILTEDFIQNWLDIVNRYASENELGPNHKLCVLLFSHLGLERSLSQRIWDSGNAFMNGIVALGEEMNL